MSSEKITKQGQWNSVNLSSFALSQYDKTIYTMSDGSLWTRVFHHANPAASLFARTDNFESGVYKDANRWFNVSQCYLVGNEKWELMIKQKPTSSSTEEVYRWVQTNNPMDGATFSNTKHANVTFTTGTGYTTPSALYGGCYAFKSNTYLVCNNNADGNWYGALGSWANHNGGIPGYNAKIITDGYIDLYLRIPPHALVEKNTEIKAAVFYEI